MSPNNHLSFSKSYMLSVHEAIKISYSYHLPCQGARNCQKSDVSNHSFVDMVRSPFQYCPSMRASKNYFRPPYFFQNKIGLFFYSWYNHDFHINTFIHFIHIVKQMHKMSVKYLKTNTKLASKVIFLFPCIIFKVNFQLWDSEMPSCNITPYQWCVYWLLGLSKDLREGLKINKGPLSGYIDSLHLWLPVGLQSIQFRPPYKVRIVRRFLTLCHPYSKSISIIKMYSTNNIDS